MRRMEILKSRRIGALELRNRVVMPPMATGLATESGEVTEELIEHYRARAPWIGLVIVEHSYVQISGKLSANQLGAYSDELVSGLRRLAESVKVEGAPVALQINHAGVKADPKLTGQSAVGPSAIRGARRMGEVDIQETVDAFGEAAGRAVEAGFDVVEIHGAHGFLLNQFTSPITNRRTDSYGGDLENRVRFPLMVVERVKGETSGRAQIWYRLGADDLDPNGNTPEDAGAMAGLLAEAGVEVFDVSGGVCGSRPSSISGPGYFAYAASAVKEATGRPVVAVGGIRTPEDAEEVISRWGVDLVAVGRALLEDPEWGKKAYED